MRHRVLQKADDSLLLDQLWAKGGFEETGRTTWDDLEPKPVPAPENRRLPTPRAALYAWHTNALLGVLADEPQAFNETPECGWFKRRMVKGGPFVPARIWMYQPTDESGELVGDEVMNCEVNGKWADADQQWSWLCGNPITEQEFLYLTASLKWAEDHAPHEPMANIHQRIDWLKVPTPTFETRNPKS